MSHGRVCSQLLNRAHSKQSLFSSVVFGQLAGPFDCFVDESSSKTRRARVRSTRLSWFLVLLPKGKHMNENASRSPAKVQRNIFWDRLAHQNDLCIEFQDRATMIFSSQHVTISCAALSAPPAARCAAAMESLLALGEYDDDSPKQAPLRCFQSSSLAVLPSRSQPQKGICPPA